MHTNIQANDAISDLELLRLREETPSLGTYAHFAHGSASLPPDAVYRAWEGWLSTEKLMGSHRAADHFAEQLGGVKPSVARLIHARPHQIALLSSATHAWSTALDAVLAASAKVHVITTTDEYGANIRCLRDASAQRRLSVSVVAAREPGSTLLQRLEKTLENTPAAITPVVAICAVPTGYGVATDLRGIAQCVERHGGFFFVDASHSVGQQEVDAVAIGCDVLVFPARKWLRGPKGMGVLYVSDRALGRFAEHPSEDVTGIRWPASMISNDAQDASRFEGHEFNPGLHLALKAACDYAHAIGLSRIQRRNRQVREMVASTLEARFGWTALEAGHPEATALMTYNIPEGTADTDTLVQRLWRAGVTASCIGHHQAPWTLEAMGAKTLLRLTPHYITTEEEIDRLARAIEDALPQP